MTNHEIRELLALTPEHLNHVRVNREDVLRLLEDSDQLAELPGMAPEHDETSDDAPAHVDAAPSQPIHVEVAVSEHAATLEPEPSA